MALLDYTLSIPDSSPIFIYSDLNSNLSLGWNVTYGSAADPTLVPGRLPPPNSLSTHRTSLVGATASISWFGTAIYLLGSGTPGAYSTSIDYQTPAIGVPSSDTNSLGSWAGLDNAKHTIELIVTEPIEVGLQGAQLSIVIGQTGYIRKYLCDLLHFMPYPQVSYLQSHLGNPRIPFKQRRAKQYRFLFAARPMGH